MHFLQPLDVCIGSLQFKIKQLNQCICCAYNIAFIANKSMYIQELTNSIFAYKCVWVFCVETMQLLHRTQCMVHIKINVLFKAESMHLLHRNNVLSYEKKCIVYKQTMPNISKKNLNPTSNLVFFYLFIMQFLLNTLM